MARHTPSAPTLDTDTSSPRVTAGGGWKARKEAMNKNSKFVKSFQVPEGEEKLVKFLEDEPFESYYRHWLRNLPQGSRQTYTCLGDNCPLCEDGDNPSFLVLFNVVDMLEDGGTLRVWEATPGPAGTIEAMAESKNYSPINKTDLYFSVSKRKESNGFFAYSLQPVKGRDLKEEWDVEPLSAQQLAEYAEQKHGAEYIRPDSRSALQELVDSK